MERLGLGSSRSGPLLEVKNLVTQFATETGPVRVVDDVSFHINEGEILGLVGESGCGKSITALSIMRLIPSPGEIADGEVLFGGRDILQLTDAELRSVRGREIAMIFQEPMTSLNPVLTIARQLTEPLRLHMNMTKQAARSKAIELLEMVGIPDAGERIDDYPHRMSGGQRQRVMIAIAMSCNPKLLIADEATTALDVTIQAQILEMMAKLTRDIGTSLLIITHNLGVVARFADRVNVMYSGRIRESGTVDEIFDNPRHPYTVGLLDSIPRFDDEERERMRTIEGEIPDPANRPSGCTFRTRCRWATDECERLEPQLALLDEAHYVACWESDSVSRERAVIV
jgi:oligopeptide transport system ATP-binding protein